MAGPLDGVRVVEITMFQQGPVCGTKLGDLGADVIKVEPLTGDPGRGKTKQVGFPWMFSQTPASVRRVAPELEEHTDELLLDLGYNQDDIAKLRQDSVI
jgi:crotonobetainyl-CoA:carnitine CoA-transferase CaiB-like acyl-CoA transferase